MGDLGKTTDRTVNAPLAREVPTIGQRHDFDAVTLQRCMTGQYEAHFQDDHDVLSLNLARGQVQSAHDSDKLAPFALEPYTINYHPVGSATYALGREDNYHFLSVRVPTTVRRDLQVAFGIADGDIRHIPGFSTPHSKALIQTVDQFLASGALGGRLVAESLATLAVAEALKAFGAAGPSTALSAPGAVPPAIVRVIDYVEAHLDADLSLDALAGVAAQNVYHFAKRFRESVGETPHAYVMRRRVERAKALLKDGRLPLADIALACGFSGQSHFTTVFGAHTGATPGKYRRAVRT